MTNQRLAIHQHRYNSWVLNSIILGTITAIMTAVFLPVGQGAFFGISLLCLIMTTSVLFSLFTRSPSSKIRTGEVLIAVAIYCITCMFLYLSGMELLHWDIPYSEYRTILHENYSGYYVFDSNKAEYQEQKDTLAITTLMSPLIVSFPLILLLGLILFGWKWIAASKPDSMYDVDFFLLNPGCAWFPWKKRVA